MKKLLGIVVLGLFSFSNVVFSKDALVCISKNKNWTYILQKDQYGKWCYPEWKECNIKSPDDDQILISWNNFEYGHSKSLFIDRYTGTFLFHKYMHERNTKIEGKC